MPKGALKWDEVGERLYETGVKHGVLYLLDETTKTYPDGVAWNGLSSVSETPSGAEANPVYADDIKYLNLYSAEDFGATVEAYTTPPEFDQCDGSAELAPGVTIGQQNRKTFGFCYRTVVGNDVSGNAYGHKIHIIYGAKASPSEKQYQTINDSPEPISMSWEITTTSVPVSPITVDGVVHEFNPTAILIIDSTKFVTNEDKAKLAELETILYGKDPTTEGGDDGVAPRLPLPDEIYSIIMGDDDDDDDPVVGP